MPRSIALLSGYPIECRYSIQAAIATALCTATVGGGVEQANSPALNDRGHSLMAAQLLHHMTHHGWKFSRNLTIRVDHTLEASRAMDWRLRAQ
ncbi:hypothetical protein [Nitrospira sp. BLG_2]|uniref:hypothetical protein n=1 Tax=Nitrospira sp. BLG_2 TaxID=3397507 RepID=UPI003B9B517F